MEYSFGLIGQNVEYYWDKWWKGKNNPDNVKRYVAGIFQKDIFSEKQLNSDLTSIIDQFKYDLQANRNQFYSEITLAMKLPDAPVKLNEHQLKAYISDVQARASKLSSKSIQRGTLIGGLLSAGSLVGTQSLFSIVNQIWKVAFESVASSDSVLSATEGGAIGTTAVSGEQEGGEIDGDVGRLVGAGIVITVGLVLDHYATKILKQKINAQVTSFITSVENGVINGQKQSPGLLALLSETINVTDNSCQNAIIAKLTNGSSDNDYNNDSGSQTSVHQQSTPAICRESE